MHLSIRWKLVLSISIPLLATYFGMLTWDYWRQRDAAVLEAQKNVTDHAQLTANHLDTRLSSIMQLVDSSARDFENRSNLSDAQIRGLLNFELRHNVWVISTSIIWEPGMQPPGEPAALIALHGSPEPRIQEFPAGERARSRSWYIAARDAHHGIWSNPYADFPSAPRVLTYAHPIFINEQFQGVVTASILVEELQMLRNRPERELFRMNDRTTSRPARELPPRDALVDRPFGATESFAILGSDGRIIASANPDPDRTRSIFDVAKDLNHKELADLAKDTLNGKGGVLRVESLNKMLPSMSEDRYHWVALAPIPSANWIFASAIPESSLIQPIVNRLWQRAAFLAGGMAILLVVVLLVSIRISRPIERLAKAVDRVAAGDLDAQVTNVRSHDEIGRLAAGFNHMTRQLKAHIAAITEHAAAREKADSELRIARQIQTNLLPRQFPPFPDRHDLDLHATNAPAAGVAGDFYDFFFTSPELLTVIIADVSGKGVPASILMAVTRTVVRNLAQAGLSPAEIARRTDATLAADTSDSMFVTLFLCQYEPMTGKIWYVNAGHPRPLRVSSSGVQVFGDVTGPLMGVQCGGELGPFTERQDKLELGETLLLFTDGVTEARNPANQMLGDEDAQAIVAHHAALAPAALCEAIVKDVERFESGQRHDDITLVALRRTIPTDS